MARELDVFLVLQIREALVVEEVFENVFERALLAVYALDLLVFDLLVASLVGQCRGRCCQTRHRDLGQHWWLGVFRAAFVYGHFDGRGPRVDGEDEFRHDRCVFRMSRCESVSLLCSFSTTLQPFLSRERVIVYKQD